MCLSLQLIGKNAALRVGVEFSGLSLLPVRVIVSSVSSLNKDLSFPSQRSFGEMWRSDRLSLRSSQSLSFSRSAVWCLLKDYYFWFTQVLYTFSIFPLVYHNMCTMRCKILSDYKHYWESQIGNKMGISGAKTKQCYGFSWPHTELHLWIKSWASQ